MYVFYSAPLKTEKGQKTKGLKQNRVTVVGDYQDGVLKIAVSRCSDKDTFTKIRGRGLATGRLLRGKIYKSFTLKEINTEKFIEIASSEAALVEKNPELVSKVILTPTFMQTA